MTLIGVFTDPGVEFRVQTSVGQGDPQVDAIYDASLYDDGVYSSDEISWFTLTMRVISFSSSRGRDTFNQNYPPGSFSFVCADDDFIFNPDFGIVEVGNQKLRVGKWARIQGRSKHSQDFITIVTGKIDSMQETYIEGGADIRMRFNCSELSAAMQRDDPPPLEVPVGAGERTDQRAQRILDAWGEGPTGPDVPPLDVGVSTMIATTLDNSRFIEMQTAAQAENGAFYFDRDGNPRFRNRSWLDDGADEGGGPGLFFFPPPRAETDHIINTDFDSSTLVGGFTVSAEILGFVPGGLQRMINNFAAGAIGRQMSLHITNTNEATISVVIDGAGTSNFSHSEVLLAGGNYTISATYTPGQPLRVTVNGVEEIDPVPQVGTLALTTVPMVVGARSDLVSGHDLQGLLRVATVTPAVGLELRCDVADTGLGNGPIVGDTWTDPNGFTWLGAGLVTIVGAGTDVRLEVGAPGDDVEITQTAAATWDASRVRNEIRLASVGGDEQRVIDTGSIARYGQRTFSRGGFENDDDGQIFDIAEEILSDFRYDRLRIDSITMQAETVEAAEELMRLEIGWRLRVQVTLALGFQFAYLVNVVRVQHRGTEGGEWTVKATIDNVDRSDPGLGGDYSPAFSAAYSIVES